MNDTTYVGGALGSQIGGRERLVERMEGSGGTGRMGAGAEGGRAYGLRMWGRGGEEGGRARMTPDGAVGQTEGGG
jgi:hypothetical protein